MIAVLGWACDRCDSRTTPPTTADQSSAEPERLPVAPGAPGTPPDDPRTDGWATEVFSSAASEQFKKIAELLQNPAKIDTARLGPLVAPDFSCGPLRPPMLRRVYQDRAIRVDRPDEQAGENPKPQPFRGIEGFSKAMRDLMLPFASRTLPRIDFKIFRVDRQATHISTQQFVHIYGRREQGSVEEHATWESQWVLNSGAEKPQLRSIAVRDYERVEVSAPSQTLFADCTEAVLAQNATFKLQLMHGVFHWAGHLEGASLPGYSGLAVADVNGDGLEDVYLCQIGGLPNRLFIQNPDGTATDQSAAAGVDWLDRTTGALFIDLDNDGDQDLILAARMLLLMFNDGKGHFTLRASAKVQFAFSLAAADYDLDGDLDIYACRYLGRGARNSFPNPLPYYDANNGPTNVLLRNEGDWQFVDVTDQTGLNANNTRFSFAASWEDFDNDGDPDLYVANDFGRNCLFRNDGGQFSNVAPQAGVEDIASSMSVSWGDFNRDGLMDLYVGNMFSTAGNRITYQRQFQPDLPQQARAHLQRHARGNSLFANNGNGTFTDVSLKTGVIMGRWAWGSIFVDLNNDGWEDAVVANGFITGQDTHDL